MTSRKLKNATGFCLAVALGFCMAVGSGCSNKDSGDSDNVTGPETFHFDAPWPSDVGSIVSLVVPDSINDQVALPPEFDAPDYSGPVSFPPVDVAGISLGIEGDFLYMRVEFAGTIPQNGFAVLQTGEVEAQTVGNQGMNVALNIDNNLSTGAGGEGIDGIDIFFAVGFEYGVHSQAYVNWDFPDGDVHHNQYHADGELGEGGPGYDYVVVRFDISDMGQFFPRGQTVEIGGWSEAESFNADGSLKYHHFAFDPFVSVMWTIPAQ